MATETLSKVSYQLKLNNGVTPQGNLKTVSLSLGKMSLTGYNTDSAYALSNLLVPCLDLSVHEENVTRVAQVIGV